MLMLDTFGRYGPLNKCSGEFCLCAMFMLVKVEGEC